VASNPPRRRMPTPVSSAIVSICLPRQPPSPDATRNRPERRWAEPS